MTGRFKIYSDDTRYITISGISGVHAQIPHTVVRHIPNPIRESAGVKILVHI